MASPGAAIFEWDMMFDIPVIADWRKIGDYRQCQTDLNIRIVYDHKVGDKILVQNKGILCKAESKWHNDPWTIVTVHTNGTIRVQRGNKLERLNI
jgi:hypothetical protein